MSTFKVGAKVRRIGDNCAGTVTGGIYTVKGFRHSGRTIMLLEFPEDEHGWSDSKFELAQEPVLTPEEVFKHLRKGTQLECSDKGRDNWCTIHSNSRVPVGQIETFQWRIKPVPEIIESFGRKYKLIEE